MYGTQLDSSVVDSTMELEGPGEEKKKRWEAKADAKSSALVAAGSGL